MSSIGFHTDRVSGSDLTRPPYMISTRSLSPAVYFPASVQCLCDDEIQLDVADGGLLSRDDTEFAAQLVHSAYEDAVYWRG